MSVFADRTVGKLFPEGRCWIGTATSGTHPYQVSNGPVGDRSYSADFQSARDAIDYARSVGLQVVFEGDFTWQYRPERRDASGGHVTGVSASVLEDNLYPLAAQLYPDETLEAWLDRSCDAPDGAAHFGYGYLRGAADAFAMTSEELLDEFGIALQGLRKATKA